MPYTFDEIPEYVAPWATSGDHSCPEGLLVPWWGPTDVPCPWSHFEFCDGREHGLVKMPDLRGFLRAPNWVMCVNGQTSLLAMQMGFPLGEPQSWPVGLTGPGPHLDGEAP